MSARTTSRTYTSWRIMLQRCNNPRNVKWAIYGGRGITVCDRWRSFDNFLSDTGTRPEGMTLDRKDNDGNYGLSNCRWATVSQQNLNRRAYTMKVRLTCRKGHIYTAESTYIAPNGARQCRICNVPHQATQNKKRKDARHARIV